MSTLTATITARWPSFAMSPSPQHNGSKLQWRVSRSLFVWLGTACPLWWQQLLHLLCFISISNALFERLVGLNSKFYSGCLTVAYFSSKISYSRCLFQKFYRVVVYYHFFITQEIFFQNLFNHHLKAKHQQKYSNEYVIESLIGFVWNYLLSCLAWS